MGNVLVIAPHPDDEVFGVGGCILHHLDRGDSVHVVICTRGEESRFGKEQVERVQGEAKRVHAFLGVTGSHSLDLPAARLDAVPGSDVNEAMEGLFRQVEPEVIYVPHPGDVHRDHSGSHGVQPAYG